MRGDGSEEVDITDLASFYNYKYNIGTSDGLGEEKNVIPKSLVFGWSIPYSSSDSSNQNNDDPRRRVHQNGTLTMKDDPEQHKVHVKISDWDISEVFPDRDALSTYPDENDGFSKNIGYISCGKFFMAIKPDAKFMTKNSYSELTVSASNMEVGKIGGGKATNEVNNYNNSVIYKIEPSPKPKYATTQMFVDEHNVELASTYGYGDASGYIGREILVRERVIPDGQNIVNDDVMGYDWLLKFDDKSLEINEDIDEENYRYSLWNFEESKVETESEECNFLMK